MRRLSPLFSIIFIVVACVPQSVPADVDAEIVMVYADVFSDEALTSLYTCAERSPELLLSRTPNIDSANIILSITPPAGIDAVPYQVGDVEFVLAVNGQNPLGELNKVDVQDIYTGRVHRWEELGWDDAPINLWVYSAEVGLYESILGSGSLSSLAYQAQNPGAMRGFIQNDAYAIGFLPRSHINENLHIILAETFRYPVLFYMPKDEGSLKYLAVCVQSH